MSSEINFCPECFNLLYPSEDTELKQLIFRCRSCNWRTYTDPSRPETSITDTINYNADADEDLSSYITKGLIDDPTLPRAPHWKCAQCDGSGAVFFQLPEQVKNDAMTLVYVCENRDCPHYELQGKEGEVDEGDEAREAADMTDAKDIRLIARAPIPPPKPLGPTVTYSRQEPSSVPPQHSGVAPTTHPQYKYQVEDESAMRPIEGDGSGAVAAQPHAESPLLDSHMGVTQPHGIAAGESGLQDEHRGAYSYFEEGLSERERERETPSESQYPRGAEPQGDRGVSGEAHRSNYPVIIKKSDSPPASPLPVATGPHPGDESQRGDLLPASSSLIMGDDHGESGGDHGTGWGSTVQRGDGDNAEDADDDDDDDEGLFGDV